MSELLDLVRRRLDHEESADEAQAEDLPALLAEIEQYLRSYVVMTEDQAVAVTLWAAHTHAIDAADCTPYLHVTAATARAGKTRLLEVLEPIVRRPWLTGRTSAAALVRRTDLHQPTLLLDESDAALGRDADREYAEALRGILGAGYRRSGRVTLCVGQGAAMTTRDFRAYGARAIAGIGALPDTIADRAIPIILRRRLASEGVMRWRERDGHAEAAPYRRALERWAKSSIATLRRARPAIPHTLDDRASDVWEPLLAIADLADPPALCCAPPVDPPAGGVDPPAWGAGAGAWHARARRAAIALSGGRQDQDIVTELLTDIARHVLSDTDESEAIASSTIIERLTALDDRPWCEWRQGRPLSARGLARLLVPLGCVVGRWSTSVGKVRGYRADALRAAIDRHVPEHARQPDPSVQAAMWSSPSKDGPELAITCGPGGPHANHEISPVNAGVRPHDHIDRGKEGVEPDELSSEPSRRTTSAYVDPWAGRVPNPPGRAEAIAAVERQPKRRSPWDRAAVCQEDR